MANYTYALGPWVRRQLDEGHAYWDAPDHASGRICLGSLPSCALSPSVEDHRPVGFFCFEPDYSPPLDYLVLGTGDCRDIQPSSEIRSDAGSVLGVTPEGDTIADWLGYWLFAAGDPTGESLWKLGTPTREGEYEIHLAEHSKIWQDKFAGVADRRWNRLRDLLRADLDKHDKDCKAEAKALKNLAKELRKQDKDKEADKADARADKVENHAEKVLDAMCRKYWCLPSELSTEIRRGKAETTHTESFNGSDSDTFGVDQTWSELGSDCDVASNQGVLVSGTGSQFYWSRCEADVSASDHDTSHDITSQTDGTSANHQVGPVSRFSASAVTGYYLRLNRYYNPDAFEIGKVVATSITVLDDASEDSPPTVNVKLRCNGSTLTAYKDSASKVVVTDSAISTGTRGGIYGYTKAGSANITIDNWSISDLVVPGWTHKIYGINLAKIHGVVNARIKKVLGT